MHAEVRRWVAAAVERFGPFSRVVEFGSRDINGSVRSLFECVEYVGLDIAPGPGVDVVADAATWRGGADVVVCCEVFEHTPTWPAIVLSARKALPAGGVFIATCASEARTPHAARDEEPLRAGEFYANVPADAMREVMRRLFAEVVVEVGRDGQDLYALGLV